MAKMILGVFGDSDRASMAISDLERLGYDPKDVSIVMKDHAEARKVSDATGATVVEGAASGATTGGIIGALAGLLVGVGAITIPGIGAVLIGGPLAVALGLSGAAATTVSGAATGALAGGLIGALTGLGVSDTDAHHYEESVRSGGVLVAIPAEQGDSDDAIKVLDRHGAQQVRTISTGERNLRHEISSETDVTHHHR
jgi:uncharacterized membrane protein